jgi:hypothetical protein
VTLVDVTKDLQPAVRLRRTLRVEAEWDEARSAGEQVLLTGPAVHDLFLDPDRNVVFLPDLVKSWCIRTGLGLVTYSTLAGATSYRTLPDGTRIDVRAQPRTGDLVPDSHPADELLRVVADLRRGARPAVLLVDYADLLLPDHRDTAPGLRTARLVEELQALASDSARWRRPGLQLFLVDRGGSVLGRLAAQPGVRIVAIDPPDSPEVTAFVEKAVAAADPVARLHLDTGLTPERAGRIGGGLLLRDFDEGRITSTEHRPLSAAWTAGRKGAAIRARSHGTLDLLDAAVSLDRDVAGMHALRLYVADQKRLGNVTMRIALAGPPGTGKTHSASAVANLLGVPMVSFGQVLGEFLGQSERNMRTAWAIIYAMAPVVVFIDEADHGLLGARDGSGHSGNEAYGALRGMMFHELGEPGVDNGISVVITTNVPTRLDARTQSRFTFLPVLWAAGPDLAKIIALHARNKGVRLDGDPTDLLTSYTDDGNVLSGRSAQELFTDARVVAARQDRTTVTPDDISAALARRLNKDWTAESEYSALVSLCHPSNVDALPWVAAATLGEPYPVPGFLRPYLDASGVPDMDKVHGRLAELEASRVWG